MSIRAQRGFTLIELLLAISILGLMSLGAYQFLANTSQSALRLNERQQELLAVERLQAVIAADLDQWVNRPIRDELGDPLPAFVLEPSGAMEFTRRGLSNPLDKPRSDMLRVRYEVREGRLWRLTWTTLDRLQGMKPLESPVGPKELQLQWRVQASPGTSVEQFWPPADAGGSARARSQTRGAPEIVNLDLDVEPWGRIRRIYWMPSNDID
jgi:general secretion pathway protein J